MAWPVVTASGGPRERGLRYGEQAAGRVLRNIEIYTEVFRHYTGLSWDQVRRRAGAFVDAIDGYDHQLLPEIEGIADGAGVDTDDILVLNLRTEIMFGLGSPECTALCASSDSASHVLLAQNWDWKPRSADTCVMLTCAPAGRPAFVTLVEAGLLAKCGMNQAGIGLATNALQSSLDGGRPGVPFHAILRKVLTSGSFEAATAAVTHARRSSSANYVIAHRDGRVVDVEATPAGTLLLEGNAFAHANHFLWRGRSFKDLGLLGGGSSRARQARADAALAGGPHTVEGFQAALRDHEGFPDSVCVHPDASVAPEADYATIASIVMDLTDEILWITDVAPCRAAYDRFEAAELFAGAARS